MLIGGGVRSSAQPMRMIGGVDAGGAHRANWGGSGALRNFHAGEATVQAGESLSEKAGYGGHRHPTAWSMALETGGMSSNGRTRIELRASANGAIGRGMAGTALVSITAQAAGGVALSGSGSAVLSIAARGALAGILSGSGSATLAMGGRGVLAQLQWGSASAALTIGGRGDMLNVLYMSGSTASVDELSAQGLAAAVWAALAASNSGTGTMGELLNGAGGGSSPGAVAAAVRAELAAELARIDAAISSRLAAGATPLVDVRYVNGVAVTGTGTEGDEWGPA